MRRRALKFARGGCGHLDLLLEGTLHEMLTSRPSSSRAAPPVGCLTSRTRHPAPEASPPLSLLDVPSLPEGEDSAVHALGPHIQTKARFPPVPLEASGMRSCGPRPRISARTVTKRPSLPTRPRRSESGSTALYHYFESKLHRLYVIMADATPFFRNEFDRHTGAHEDFLGALLAVLRGSVRPQRAGRAAQSRSWSPSKDWLECRGPPLARRRPGLLARARVRDVEFAWATFLVRGMEQGILPGGRSSPSHSRAARAVQQHLALDRPRGSISLDEVREFFLRRQLAVLLVSRPSWSTVIARSSAPPPRRPAVVRGGTRGTRGRRRSAGS